mgnify:CR=1 FL=1
MGAPITWRNVEGPDLGQASRGMALAQIGFNNGFDKLGEVLKAQTDQGLANWDAEKANNTAAFMEQMRQYRTPEDFAAAQQAGAFDQARFGAQIDRAAINAALDARPGVLQQRGLAEVQYTNAMQDQKDHPDVQAYKAAAANGDALTMAIIRNNNPNIRNIGDMVQAGVQQLQTNTTNRNANIAADNAQKLAPVALENARLTGEHLKAQTAGIKAEADFKAATAGFNSVTTSLVNRFEASKKDYNKQVTGLAQTHGIPVDAQGMPNFAGLPAEKLKAYQADLSKVAKPSSSGILEEFDQLSRGSGLPPDKILAARESLDKLLSTSNFSTAETAKLKGFQERQEKRIKDAQTNNLFFTSEEERVKEKASVLEHVNSSIKDGEVWTKRPIINTLSEWMDKGLPIKRADGTVETIPIPPKLMKAALASGMEHDTMFFNDTTGNVEAKLREYLSDPKYQKQREDAEALSPANLNRERAAQMQDITKQAGHAPESYAVEARLQAALDNANKAASANATAAANAASKAAAIAPNAAIPGNKVLSVVSPSDMGARLQKRLADEAQKKSPEVVQPTPGSNAQPTSFAVPVPKGHTVGEVQTVGLNPVTGAVTKAADPRPIPKDVAWSAPVVAEKATKPGGQIAKVTYVQDGDGASLQLKDGSSVSCRIAGIDAPETAKPKHNKPGQPYGEESKKSLQEAILNKEVTLTIVKSAKPDKYGRELCEIEIQGQSVGLKQVQEGLAWVYERYVSGTEGNALRSAEAQARAFKKGLWADPTPVNPETFKLQKR